MHRAMRWLRSKLSKRGVLILPNLMGHAVLPGMVFCFVVVANGNLPFSAAGPLCLVTACQWLSMSLGASESAWRGEDGRQGVEWGKEGAE